MISDIFLAILFASILFRASAKIQACIFFIAGVLAEVFSTLPFGVSIFVLALGVFAARRLKNIFDEASFASFLASFLGGLFVYLFMLGLARFWFLGGLALDHAVRTGIQYARNIVFISLFFACLAVIRFGIGRIYYAFKEKKIAPV